MDADLGYPIYLGYNIGEDPALTAQQFVAKHNLKVGFLSEVSHSHVLAFVIAPALQIESFLMTSVPELSQDGGFVRGQEFVRVSKPAAAVMPAAEEKPAEMKGES